jgi:hypothetical protein
MYNFLIFRTNILEEQQKLKEGFESKCTKTDFNKLL